MVTTSTVVIDPPRPRLGDPVLLYVTEVDHQGEIGSVEVFGYQFSLQPLGARTLRAVIGIPADLVPGKHPVTFEHPHPPAAWPQASIEVVDREFKRSELKVSTKFTKKKRSKALQRRLAREAAEIQDVWSLPPSALRALGRPIRPTRTRITGVYGTVRVFNGKRTSVHYGVDFRGRVGEPVIAVADGRVVMSAMRWHAGGTLVIDHGGGLLSTYFHLSKRRVKLGDEVRKGQRIGDVGRSGRVTGPHLHFGIAVRAVYPDGTRQGRARSLYVDPEGFWSLNFSATPP